MVVAGSDSATRSMLHLLDFAPRWMRGCKLSGCANSVIRFESALVRTIKIRSGHQHALLPTENKLSNLNSPVPAKLRQAIDFGMMILWVAPRRGLHEFCKIKALRISGTLEYSHGFPQLLRKCPTSSVRPLFMAKRTRRIALSQG